jgi:hypothetical protein
MLACKHLKPRPPPFFLLHCAGINFCNEKLQQHFNYHVFKQETTTYMAEEITFSEVKFVDNQDVLDMVELRPDGLLVMLDDECRVPKGSDLGYLDKIKKTHAANHRFVVRCAAACPPFPLSPLPTTASCLTSSPSPPHTLPSLCAPPFRPPSPRRSPPSLA